jgi:hypothetical protein
LANVSDRERAAKALDRLMELSPEMRGGAIVGPDNEESAGSTTGPTGKRQTIAIVDALAATGDADAWGDAALALLDAAETDGAFDQIHVATEAGEVFAIREGELTAIAVTERFVLASLMAFDMRATLRDLAAGASTGAA